MEWACDRPGAALFLEQGVGKTWIAGGIVEWHMGPDDGPMSALLVVPLANLETTWHRLLSQIDGLAVCRTWEEFKAAKPRKGPQRHRLLLINYEKVRKLVKRMKKVEWSLIVYDESQRLKGRGSKQSRDADRLDADHRVLLSGTPIEQAPEDLWGQFRFAMPELLGHRWKDFESKWMYKTGFMGKERVFRQEMMPEFLELIQPHILRITKEEVLDMPPVKYIRQGVPLLGDQLRVYTELTRDMMSTLGDREITCNMAVTQLVRQQQVCGGFVRVDPTEAEKIAALEESERTGEEIKPPKGPVLPVGRAKLRRLQSVLSEEAGNGPFVIFCQYKWELAAIVALLHRNSLRVGVIQGARGKGGKKKRVETVDAFQRGELDALVCQIRAGGVGLDLQTACVGIFYSATWSWIDFDQAVSRLHRSGQTRPVRFHLLFCQNTVDELVYEALLMKRSVTELILSRSKRHG